MSLRYRKIAIACEHCRFAGADGHDGFDVEVPVRDGESGLEGTARLSCRISPEGHALALTGWTDAAGQPLSLPANTRDRVAAALAFVEGRRLCGTRNLCPGEVVRIAAETGRD